MEQDANVIPEGATHYSPSTGKFVQKFEYSSNSENVFGVMWQVWDVLSWRDASDNAGAPYSETIRSELVPIEVYRMRLTIGKTTKQAEVARKQSELNTRQHSTAFFPEGLEMNPPPVSLAQLIERANRKPVQKHSHYFKPCPYNTVDVYRVLRLFNVTDPCIAHATKKLLVAGGRGAGKDIKKDVREAIDSLQRFLEMQAEDEA